MSKGRLIIGIIFLILLAYFSINLISILYSHHAFGASDKGNGNDKTTKSDNRPNDHPACGGDACPVNNKDQPQPKKHTTTTTSSSSDGIQGEPNVLCRRKIIHHLCEPCPVGFKDTGTKCVPVNQKQKQQHPPGGPCEARINCPPSECKKGEFINPITHKCVPKGKCVDICPPKPVHHSKAYNQGYQMGCRDGPDQENFIGTGGLAHHSKSIR
jgi:hypothetical protein